MRITTFMGNTAYVNPEKILYVLAEKNLDDGLDQCTIFLAHDIWLIIDAEEFKRIKHALPFCGEVQIVFP